jgi:putative transposase
MLLRNRTSSKYIFYALHLYFSGLSIRKTSQHLSAFVKRNYVSIWNWIHHYKPEKMFHRKRTIYEFIVDETLIKVGDEFAWLWIATEPKAKTILGIRISYERSMLIAERFMRSLVRKYERKHPASTDGGRWYPLQACKFLKIKHHIHSSYEKSVIERSIQYIKDRTESFDDYFLSCRKETRSCKLEHILNWFNMFIDMHNRMITL